jgi:hypothetical protein
MYFAAGPNHGAGGLFGYLTAVSAELTEGNSQQSSLLDHGTPEAKNK